MRCPENPSTPAQVRTRQGCLTCRRRRRKCDEQKPECQNCVGRGLGCRYGVHLAFRSCNLLSLEPEDARALSETTPRLYRHIRFVDGLNESETSIDSDLNKDDDVPSFQGSPSETLETLERAESDRRVASSSIADRENDQREPQDRIYEAQFYGDRAYGTDNSETTEDYNDDERSNQISGLRPSILAQSFGRPRSAMNDPVDDHRVAEGSHGNQLMLALPSPGDSLHASSVSVVNSTATDYSKNWLPRLKNISKVPSFAATGRPPQTLANDNVNMLLKYYIDEVAPWLDISTSERSFGVHVPILSKEYKPLLHSILALSAQFQSLLMPPDNSRATQSAEFASLAITSIGTDIYSSRDAPVIACTLLLIHKLLSTQIHDWRPLLKSRIDLLKTLGVNGTSNGYHGSVSWLTLRLDLALGLVSAMPPMISTEKWQSTSSPPSDSIAVDVFEHTTQHLWTRQSILLCSQAAQLQFSTDMTSRLAIDRWLHLWKSTRSWFESLPLPMHPIFTSPISAICSATPSFFPIILYSSRSSMFSAVLYHTLYALLLQSKPRSVRVLSSVKTPTWHAVQICGICIGNNACWSYDPTILAALVYASRFISYQEQKQELREFVRPFTVVDDWSIASIIHEI